MSEVRSSSSPTLDAATHCALQAFMNRLGGRYAVKEGILYGSRARRAHTADSDADFAVVLQGPPGDRGAIGRDMAGIAFDVLLETGILVDALPLWDDDLANPGSFGNGALIGAVLRDGLRLPVDA